jgi:hypothetical protein
VRTILNTGMTVLAADIQLPCMQLVRERNRLLGSITDIGDGVSNSEENDEEDAKHSCTGNRATNLHSHVEPA